MTRLLEKAFEEAAKLPEGEQDSVASWLLSELESEKRWQDAFASSADRLKELADEALAEHCRGETQELDPDRL